MSRRKEEISVVNPQGTFIESQFVPSFPEPSINSLPSDPRHAAEEDQSPPLHDHLRNLEIKESHIDWEEDRAKRKENRESDVEFEEYNETKLSAYPLRPDAEDCAYYMRTGKCKYEWSCKFNHPHLRINQVIRDTFKEKENFAEKSNQAECKYYLRTGGCMYGDTCRFVHSTTKSPVPPNGDTCRFVKSMARTPVPPVSELNFLGLPIRRGEKECPYYMRHGSCKFGANCKFNHPDPTTGDDSPSAYSNGVSGGSVSSETNVLSWSASRPLTETPPFVPVTFSRTRKFSSQPPEWDAYQASLYAQEQSMHPRSAYLMDHSTATDASVFAPLSMDDEFPERPDQAECSYYMKTGDCKFKSNCKFHHPKNRTLKPPPCILSDKGLPLRPDQNICAHYGRYGICKFGPACKFDHPIHQPSSTSSDPDQPSNNSPATEYASNNGSQTHI